MLTIQLTPQQRKLIEHLGSQTSGEMARVCMRYFKTGKGQYGYGDQFIGINVPILRKIAKEFKDLSLK